MLIVSNSTMLWSSVARELKRWGMHKAAHVSRNKGRYVHRVPAFGSLEDLGWPGCSWELSICSFLGLWWEDLSLMTLGNHSGGLSVQQKGYLKGSYALILISVDQTNQIKPPSTKHKQQMAHRSRQLLCDFKIWFDLDFLCNYIVPNQGICIIWFLFD